MSAEEPPIISSEKLEPEPPAEVEGEEIDEPTVPVADDFTVTKVVRLPEDPNERQRIREEYESSGPSAHVGLGDAGVGREAVSRGHKGRSRRPKE